MSLHQYARNRLEAMAMETLISAAIKHFRSLPAHTQQYLMDTEPLVNAHNSGPNLCGEIVLPNPCTEIDLGERAAQIQESKYGDRQIPKEPGQRAYEILMRGDRRINVPTSWWRSLRPDLKADWARVEKELEPELRPVVAKDHYLSLEELIHRMKLMQDRWFFLASDGRHARTNLPEQALACMMGMKAEITAFEAQFAPDPDHKPLSEPDCFKIEAAMQYGFIPHDDDATIYRATEQQIVNLMDAARKQGLDDAITALQEKANG